MAYTSEPFDRAMTAARAKGWRVYEVACGHDVMLDLSERLVEILQENLPFDRREAPGLPRTSRRL
jgi:hypothetical protein